MGEEAAETVGKADRDKTFEPVPPVSACGKAVKLLESTFKHLKPKF